MRVWVWVWIVWGKRIVGVSDMSGVSVVVEGVVAVVAVSQGRCGRRERGNGVEEMWRWHGRCEKRMGKEEGKKRRKEKKREERKREGAGKSAGSKSKII